MIDSVNIESKYTDYNLPNELSDDLQWSVSIALFALQYSIYI